MFPDRQQDCGEQSDRCCCESCLLISSSFPAAPAAASSVQKLCFSFVFDFAFFFTKHPKLYLPTQKLKDTKTKSC
jgi:hypothetical protein